MFLIYANTIINLDMVKSITRAGLDEILFNFRDAEEFILIDFSNEEDRENHFEQIKEALRKSATSEFPTLSTY